MWTPVIDTDRSTGIKNFTFIQIFSTYIMFFYNTYSIAWSTADWDEKEMAVYDHIIISVGCFLFAAVCLL